MSRYKFACTQWGMPGEGYYAVRVAKEAGLDGVQLDFGTYEYGYPMAQKYVQDMYLEDAAKYGIEFPSLVLNDLGCHGFVNGRNSEDGKIAYEMMELGIKVAADMKIGTVMIPCFFNNFITEEKHYDNAVEALQFCCDLASGHGITIANETVLSPENHRKIVDRVKRPNLGIFFDSMNYSFFSKLDQMNVLTNSMGVMVPQLHIKDGTDILSGALLGEGKMDFTKQAEYIAKSDFTGWIILENYYSRLPIRKDSVTDQLELLRRDIVTAKKALHI